MRLKVLVDNYTYIDEYYYGEPGLSYYIEDDGVKILFDMGYSDLYIKNARAMGIDITDIDTLVFSHGHDDHTRGLMYYFKEAVNKETNIVAHPKTFNKKYSGQNFIGSPYSLEELDNLGNLKLTKQPKWVSKNIIFLGEIPRKNDFEVNRSIGKRQEENGEFVEDDLIDDSALCYKTDKGIYIITGCSHSGICNIIEYAKQVLDTDVVLGVIGGFHLLEDSGMVNKTISYLKDNNIDELYPCHCTSFDVKAHIHSEIRIKEVGVGLELLW